MRSITGCDNFDNKKNISIINTDVVKKKDKMVDYVSIIKLKIIIY